MNEKRILNILSQVDEKYIKEAEPVIKTKNNKIQNKWTYIAACFITVAILITGVFQIGKLHTNKDIVILDSGEIITFYKSYINVSSLDANISIGKNLTAKEIKMLFEDLPVTAFSYFDSEHNNIVGLEGKINNIKIIISKSGTQLSDTEITGKEKASTVNGISVNAGYFISKANSNGIKTAIYYSSFMLKDNVIYLENAGVEEDIETLKNELAAVIQQLIQIGEFDLNILEHV